MLNTPSASEFNDAIHLQFTALTGLDKMPPVYRQIGNSQSALSAYLAMEQCLVDSKISDFDIEVIKLARSAANQCEFCIGNHRRKGKAAGLSDEDIERLAAGLAPQDPRALSIYQLLDQLLAGGDLPQWAERTLEDLGYDDGMRVELAMAVATISFTNWFNHINHTR